MIQVSSHFEDKDYIVLEFAKDDMVYIFLYDKKQGSAFLGLREEPIELKELWEKHQQDRNYCLPCELMLCFKKRLALARKYPPLEMGLFWTDAQVLLEKVDKVINLPGAIKNNFKF
ncbi:MAG: hypothetical protein LWW94_01140 [Candidatus Desulfofervidaceae bacterium]|nr:hypothetical protein [Candidatus Desulfofervidaceae bacterium]